MYSLEDVSVLSMVGVYGSYRYVLVFPVGIDVLTMIALCSLFDGIS
jgi:hypothetical protein